MAVTFKVPASPKRSVFQINEFLGVDLTNIGTDVDDRKSPNAPNMVRSVPSKVRKRLGYELIHDFNTTNPIYGTHILQLGEEEVDAVTNTNRALNTSSSYQAFSLTQAEQKLYSYGTPFFTGQTIYYDFYYTLSKGIASIKIADEWIDLEPASDAHITGTLVYIPTSHTEKITESYVKISENDPSSLTLKLDIKMFSVMYDQNSEYRYEKAPEDVNKPFLLTNVANIGERNFSNIVGDNRTITSKGLESWTEIDFDVNSNQEVMAYNYLYLKFKASTTTSGTNSIKISARYGNGESYLIYSGSSINQKDFTEIIPSNISGAFFTSLKFEYSHKADVEETYSASFTDLKLSYLKPKTQFLPNSTIKLYHVGKELYVENHGEYTLIYSSMNEHRSQSWQFNSYIYIVDGKNFLRYKSGDLEMTDIVAAGIGKIPVVTIAREPSGGGTSYEDRNLLQAGYEERFLGDGTSTRYQLSYYPLDDTPVTVKIMKSEGEFEDMNEDNGFVVDRERGIVQFSKAPSKTPLDGEDNVYITAYKTTEDYAERIKKCTIGTLYGVNGESDRLFLSGNPSKQNQDWYSEIGDPTYFADTSYSTLGSETSAILGYTRIGNYLATHKDEKEVSQSVFVRIGEYRETYNSDGEIETTTIFKIVKILQGAGAISKYAFGYLDTEPLFLTREGIFAITSQDITGEKYSQNRSFFLNGQMTKESDLANSYSVNFDNYFILATNDKLYLLDGLQPLATDKSMPYATRQYVGFYCTNIPAYVMWTENNALWFGTRNGRIFRFNTDTTALDSYNDDGKPIEAWWETPDLDGRLFYKNKTFRYLAVRLMSSLATSITLYGKKHGLWTLLKEDNSSARYFAFSKIVFSKFSFSVDTSEKLAHTKIRIKKVDKARFKLENKELNEPFGLYDLALEYIESGNYKG